MNNRELGAQGEDIACEYLKKNGYEIVERNKHFSTLCEIDIIAKLKKKYVFVEVKTRRTNAFGAPFEAITKTKYQNIKTGVLSYLQENKVKDYQIDVVGITLEPCLKIEHLRNI
jgi:putative endonuclease